MDTSTYPTKKDLENELKPIKYDISVLKKDVSGLKKDVSSLNQKYSNLELLVLKNTHQITLLNEKFDKSEEKNEERYNNLMDKMDGLIGRFNSEEQKWGLVSFCGRENAEAISNHEERITNLEEKILTTT